MKKTYIKYNVLVAVLAWSTQQAKAQQGFGTDKPSKASAIEMKSNNKGLLIPRVALNNINSFGPISGETNTSIDKTNALLVYNTATAGTAPNNVTPGYYYWTTDGTTGKWNRLASADDMHTLNNNWKLLGNADTNPAGGTSTGTDFLGTTDATDFQIKVNNADIMRVKNTNGHVQFGNRAYGADNVQDPDQDIEYGVVNSAFTVANNIGASNFATGSNTNNVSVQSNITAQATNRFVGFNNLSYFTNGSTQSFTGGANRVRLVGGIYTTPANTVSQVGSNSLVLDPGVTLSPTFGTYVSHHGVFNAGTITTALFGNRTDFSGNGTYANTTGYAVRHAAGSFAGARSYGFFSEFTGGTYPTAGSRQISFYSNITDADIKNGYGLYIENVSGTESQHGITQVGTDDINNLSGNTLIGHATTVPTNKLHVVATANPVRLEGLQASIDATDNIVVADGTGVLKTVAASALVPAATEPWFKQTDGTQATANTDHIYQMGKVAINKTTTNKQLEVVGNFKAEVTVVDPDDDETIVYGTEIDHPILGAQTVANYWMNTDTDEYKVATVGANAATMQAATPTVTSLVSANNAHSMMASFQNNKAAKSEIRTENTGNFFMETYNVANEFASTISLQDDGLRLVHSETGLDPLNPNPELQPFLAQNHRSEIMVQKEEGVRFNFRDEDGDVKAEYWFPTEQGNAGQVLTRVGGNKTTWTSTKDMVATPKFFYMPSIIVPTSEAQLNAVGSGKTAADEFDDLTGEGSIDLHARYTVQFGTPMKSNPTQTTTLPTLDADELDYNITWYDINVFSAVEVNNLGVMTYTVAPGADVTVGSFMNIVFSVK